MPNLIKKIRTNAGDLQIDYNALANLPTISNPNLLINSDFRNPVNQRGQTTYTEGTERYGVDRWLLYNSTREVVNSGSITVTNVGEATTWFAQKFERPLDNSESYAITVKVGAITGNGAYVSIGNQDEATTPGILQTGINKFIVDTNEITSAMEQFVVTLPVGTSVELIYIKLEQGSTATPFVPRLYGEELMLCQRYYQRYASYMLFPQFYENQYHGFYFRVPLRVSPYVASFVASSTDGTNVSVGASVGGHVEIAADCVRRLFAGNEYKGSAIQLELLELDAEIY